MIILIILITLLGFFEIRSMRGNGYTKEIAVFIVFALLSIFMGFLDEQNIYEKSIAQIILRIIGKSL